MQTRLQKGAYGSLQAEIRHVVGGRKARKAFAGYDVRGVCSRGLRGDQEGPVTRCSAATTTQSDQQVVPPKTEDVEIDGVDVLQIQKNVTMLRCVCSKRLKYEIEYSRKRGTTDNSYILQDDKKAILIDVPDEAFAAKYVEILQKTVKLEDISDLVITHITPRRAKTLAMFLRARKRSRDPLRVHLSNPGMQSMTSMLGKEQNGAELLSNIHIKVARSGDIVTIGKQQDLKLIPTPTPRWPDLVCAYNSPSRLLFTSKLFSAHVAPGAVGEDRGSPFDLKGWETYEQDWHYFFDCMLAPVARQASGNSSSFPY